MSKLLVGYSIIVRKPRFAPYYVLVLRLVFEDGNEQDHHACAVYPDDMVGYKKAHDYLTQQRGYSARPLLRDDSRQWADMRYNGVEL